MKNSFILIVLAVSFLYGCSMQSPQPNNTPTNITANTSAPPQSTSCGTNLNCLIGKSSDCTPSDMMYSQSIDLFGSLINNTEYLRINGSADGKCLLYIKTENVTVVYDNSTVQELINSGMTMAQIGQQEMNASEQATNGPTSYDDYCKFSNNDLTNMLTNWNAGTFSSTDFSNADCSGKFFGTKCSSNADCGMNGVCENGICSQGTQSAGNCTNNSDCGPNGLCNLANGQCVGTLNVSYGCMSDSDCASGESCDVMSGECQKKNLTINPNAPESPFNFQYSLDPYPNGPTQEKCRFFNGSDFPAMPDAVLYTTSLGVNQLREFGHYFVEEWFSYCIDNTNLKAMVCNPEPGAIAGEKIEGCSSDNTCFNGRCISTSMVSGQTKCSEFSAQGGRTMICDGYQYQQTDGFVLTPHVSLVKGGWNATVDVKYDNITTEFTPVFSGPNETRYFTKADGSATIAVRVDSYGQYEQGKVGMVIDVQPRYGIDPSLLNG